MRISPLFPIALGVIFSLGFLVLASTLYRVQVTDVGHFIEILGGQSKRNVQLPGIRGRILDRNGLVLASSRPCRNIICRANELSKGANETNLAEKVFSEIDRLSEFLGKPKEIGLERVRSLLRQSSALPIVVWKDIDETTLARFAEHSHEFPSFDDSISEERIYDYGSLAAHLIGYTGHDRPATDPDAGEVRYHYYEQEIRGRSGLELVFNDYLAGVSGRKTILVDARGLPPKKNRGERFTVTGGDTDRAAVSGLDLTLTIDARIQSAVERELRGVVGAAVVIDPRDGAVRALASAPSFNPNDFVPFLSEKLYRKLLSDPDIPLLNRATTGLYAPGSTFKPITALVAMESGIDPAEAYTCTGAFTLSGMKLRCWDYYGHGPIGLRRALEQSCNTYFANCGYRLGTNALFSAAREFGLAQPTGIEIPERRGSLSNDAWMPGDLPKSAIGQGQLQVTPLQMAVVAATLANGGKVYKPYLHALMDDMPPPKPVRTVRFASSNISLVREGMRDVVEKGTGKKVLWKFNRAPELKRLPGFPRGASARLAVNAAAKTGTAEVGYGAKKRKNTWVIAFAPFENPTLAIAMVVENGESGGSTVAPKIYNIFASVFGERQGEVK